MLENTLIAAGMAVPSVASVWLLSIAVSATLVLVIAGCACCKCTRKMKGMDDESPYDRPSNNGGVLTLNYQARGQSPLNKSGVGQTVVTTNVRPMYDATAGRQQQPLLDPGGGHNKNTGGTINRALPSLPDAEAGRALIHHANNISMTRDSSISEMYASVDKTTAPTGSRLPNGRGSANSSFDRDDGISRPGTEAFRSGTSTTVITTTSDHRTTIQTTDPSDTNVPGHTYTQIPRLRDRDDYATTGTRTSEIRVDGVDNSYAQIDKTTTPSSANKQGDRHQYEYPIFPGRQQPSTTTAVHYTPQNSGSKFSSATNGNFEPPAEPGYSMIERGPTEPLYTGSMGSEDPYASIGGVSNQGHKEPTGTMSSGDEPWYAKVDDTRRSVPRETNGAELYSKITTSGLPSTSRDYDPVDPDRAPPTPPFPVPSTSNAPAASYSAINKQTHQRRSGSGTPVDGYINNNGSNTGGNSQYRQDAVIYDSADQVLRPDQRGSWGPTASGGESSDGQISDGNTPKREPSYRYITVRESLDVLRERMAAQARELEAAAPPWRPPTDYQQDPAGHYYSTIGSDNGYETVPGNETPQHLYEDITQLNNNPSGAGALNQRRQTGDADEAGYAYVTGPLLRSNESPGPSVSAQRTPPPSSRRSLTHEPSPPRPPTSPIPSTGTTTNGAVYPRTDTIPSQRPISAGILTPPESTTGRNGGTEHSNNVNRVVDPRDNRAFLAGINRPGTDPDDRSIDRSISLSDDGGIEPGNDKYQKETVGDPGYEIITDSVGGDKSKQWSTPVTPGATSSKSAKIVKPPPQRTDLVTPATNAATNWEGKAVERSAVPSAGTTIVNRVQTPSSPKLHRRPEQVTPKGSPKTGQRTQKSASPQVTKRTSGSTSRTGNTPTHSPKLQPRHGIKGTTGGPNLSPKRSPYSSPKLGARVQHSPPQQRKPVLPRYMQDETDTASSTTGSPRDLRSQSPTSTAILMKDNNQQGGLGGSGMHQSQSMHETVIPSLDHYRSSEAYRSQFSKSMSPSKSFTDSPTTGGYRSPPSGLIAKESLSIEIFGRRVNSPDSCFSSVPSSSATTSPSKSSTTTRLSQTATSGFGEGSVVGGGQQNKAFENTGVSDFNTLTKTGGGGGGTLKQSDTIESILAARSQLQQQQQQQSQPKLGEPEASDSNKPTTTTIGMPDQTTKRSPGDYQQQTTLTDPSQCPVELYLKAKRKAQAEGGAAPACYCHGGGDKEAIIFNNVCNMEKAKPLMLSAASNTFR